MATREQLELMQEIADIPMNIDPVAVRARFSNEWEKRAADILNSGAPYKPRPLSWRERLARRLERIRDAWLVLTGRADIGE